ncbi:MULTISPECIES: PAAR domain-containing protein [Enterobacter]|uniref:PAAR domain-containing protein n=1 Tax=Enterobacter TaxID=547 RepID=UPI000FEB7D02|nr:MULTISPECIES: PAAR domain-containing protein [Enterobacter]MCR1301745.1 PAAR domain-containing protein [Enterobacter sp. FL1277]MCR1306090.1 PAAR domain-containing protein [Enterobacter sp. BT1271]MCR1312609.1 PAAR domain-containing protein [Enterobacter sp. BT855]MCR1322251.1 PAAR domain-containing protein [Enterobacter sp. BT1268]MCR1327550.1 PAAR domain-containing protein [Enterobacter sp. BT1131]
MAVGHFLFRGDKTVCGGRILEGFPDHQFFGKDMACEGHQVTCGKHPGRYRICGGLDTDDIHGKRIAGTLHSRSSCPCKSRFIPSIFDTYELSTGQTETNAAQSHNVEFPVLPGPIAGPETDNFADTCKPEDNQLLNGVYIWTETTDAGHAFVSVHQNNSIYVYTYGRFDRKGPATLTGDGILNFLTGDDARLYYREELYKVRARVFQIDDVTPEETRRIFESLWNSGTTPVFTNSMGERTKRNGKVIDVYDLTGSNCTTHTVKAIRKAGTNIFDTSYTSTTTQLRIDNEEDFTIPVSLQRYLTEKSDSLSSMNVIEVTSKFREQYPNIDHFKPNSESLTGRVEEGLANSASTVGSSSGYSGGTIGGVLGGSYDIDE